MAISVRPISGNAISSYIYVCTASNTWKRAAIATW